MDVGNLGDDGPYATQMEQLIENRSGQHAEFNSNANLAEAFADVPQS